MDRGKKRRRMQRKERGQCSKKEEVETEDSYCFIVSKQ